MTAHEFVHHRCPSLLFSAQSITEPGAHWLANGAPGICFSLPCSYWSYKSTLFLLAFEMEESRVGMQTDPSLQPLKPHSFPAWIKTFDLSSLVASSPTSLTPSPWNWTASYPDTAKGRQMERSLKAHFQDAWYSFLSINDVVPYAFTTGLWIYPPNFFWSLF